MARRWQCRHRSPRDIKMVTLGVLLAVRRGQAFPGVYLGTGGARWRQAQSAIPSSCPGAYRSWQSRTHGESSPPILATQWLRDFGSWLPIALYIVFACVVTAIAVLSLRESKGVSLLDIDRADAERTAEAERVAAR